MSVSGTITYGIGPKGSLQFLLLDGLSLGIAAAPAAAVIGGMVKRRHSKRFEVLLDGVTLIGRSLPDLERKVVAWRAAHPKAKEVVPVESTRTDTGATEPLAREQPPQVESPNRTEAPSNTGAGAPAVFYVPQGVPGAQALFEAAADQAQRMARHQHVMRLQDAMRQAQAQALEDDDMDVLRLILEKVA